MEEKIEADTEIILPEDMNQDNLENNKVKVEETNIFRDVISRFKDAGNEVLRRHKQGTLPIQIFAFVIVYNFILFQAEEGKELYVLLPLILAGITYWLKYWENPKKTAYYFSSISLFTGLILDSIVSISFIPTYTNWGYNLDTIPTLIADLIALFSAILWFSNEKDYLFNNMNNSN
ncbi:MAG: hypothetical protein HeimC2_06870 [Candidatus Heimdallarchaeota archaeon LC_2]|nr:MAG: hypothetical protein HeimC2_06870 [Candidatus Heimdallarchaeota archaeon LC_2]